MSDHNEGANAYLLGVIRAWRTDSWELIEDISRRRNAAGDPPDEHRFTDDRLTMFGLSTSEIAGWFLRNCPQIDFQPILRVYEVAQKWSADKDYSRLQDVREVETQWDMADILVFTLELSLTKPTEAQRIEIEKNKKLKRSVPAKAIRDKTLEARDRWIYAECCKGTAYDRIAIMLEKKPAGWPRIESKQGIMTAASRYAARHGLPPIPKRQE